MSEQQEGERDLLENTIAAGPSHAMAASRERRERPFEFYLQVRHADGRRWVNVRGFGSDLEAREELERLVRESDVEPGRYRVHEMEDLGGD